MKPLIDNTQFGSITIGGKTFDHDVVVRLNGEIVKRKKKLSKAVYGTSHKVSKDEAKFVHEDGAQQIIIGTGQNGLLKLSAEAEEYFRKKKCRIAVLPTPKAIETWNNTKDEVVGLFHVTC